MPSAELKTPPVPEVASLCKTPAFFSPDTLNEDDTLIAETNSVPRAPTLSRKDETTARIQPRELFKISTAFLQDQWVRASDQLSPSPENLSEDDMSTGETNSTHAAVPKRFRKDETPGTASLPLLQDKETGTMSQFLDAMESGKTTLRVQERPKSNEVPGLRETKANSSHRFKSMKESAQPTLQNQAVTGEDNTATGIGRVDEVVKAGAANRQMSITSASSTSVANTSPFLSRQNPGLYCISIPCADPPPCVMIREPLVETSTPSTTPPTPSYKSATSFSSKETSCNEQQECQSHGHRPCSSNCTGCMEEPCGTCSYCNTRREGSCIFRPCSTNQSQSTLYNRHAAAQKLTTSDKGVYLVKKYDRVYLNGDKKIREVLDSKIAGKQKNDHGGRKSACPNVLRRIYPPQQFLGCEEQLEMFSDVEAEEDMSGQGRVGFAPEQQSFGEQRQHHQDDVDDDVVIPTVSTQSHRGQRCNNCSGCREQACGTNCRKCMDGHYNACYFRPCVNYAPTTLMNKYVRIHFLIEKNQMLRAKCKRAFSESTIQKKMFKAEAYEATERHKKRARLWISPNTDTTLSQQGFRRRRCNNCSGCNEEACGACACSEYGPGSCSFRPCHDLSEYTIFDRHKRAQRMKQMSPNSFQERYDRAYSDPRLQSILEKKPPARKKRTRSQLDEKYDRDENEHEVLLRRSSRSPAKIMKEIATEELSMSGTQHKGSLVIGRRCGLCTSCQLENECGTCISCQSKKTGTNASKLCILRLCPRYDYAISTLKDYWRFSQRSCSPREEFRLLFNSMYGNEGWVTVAIKPRDENADIEETEPSLSVSDVNNSQDENKGSLAMTRRKRAAQVEFERFADQGEESSVYVAKGSGKKCGLCRSCQLEKRCGFCETCRVRKLGNKSKGCIMQICEHYGYALKTLKYYWRFATKSNPPDEFQELFDSIYGKDGWVTKKTGENEEAIIQQERHPASAAASMRVPRANPKSLTSTLAKDVPNPRNVHVLFNTHQAEPTGKKCGSCRSCRLETRCRTCIQCLGKAGNSTGCILKLCQRVDYAYGTLKLYARHAKQSSLSAEFQSLFDSMFGKNGWVIQAVAASHPARGRESNGLGQRKNRLTSSTDKLRNDRTSCGSPRDLEVGSRCYAKYLNGQWYWSTVTSVSGNGTTRLFSVKFEDDGDVLTELPSYCVIAEEELAKAPERTEHRQCSDLWKQCCNECYSCVKEDCGKCQSCKGNKRQINALKNVCQMKMCLSIPIEERKQPLSGPLKGFSYYITAPSQSTLVQRTPAAHPDLEGLVIMEDKSGTMYGTIRDACRSLNLSPEVLQEAEANLYCHTLGVSLTKEIDHHLLGKGFYQEWRNCTGKRKEVHGTISSCRKDELDDSLLFTVTINDKDCQETVVNQSIEINSEEDVWGGFMAYMKKSGQNIDMALMRPPFYRTYILPSQMSSPRYNTSTWIPVLACRVNNYLFELEARKSSIRNAGLGLWVTCKLTCPSSKNVFELPEGTLIDLGVYATTNDCKGEHLSLLKNFIHSWTPEIWSYDSTVPYAGSVYDITDDVTGDLQETARRNPIVYVNETDGNSVPAIYADSDHEGSIHYFLGHPQAGQGPFLLPIGMAVELKIDYGPRYESVRVRKGYPRLTGQELKNMRNQIEQDDNDVLRALHEFTVLDIRDSIDFMNSVFQNFLIRDGEQLKKVERALIATIVMKERFEKIRNELETSIEDGNAIGSDEFSSLVQEEIAEKIGALLSHLLSLFPCGVNQLKNCLFANDWYRMVLQQELCLKRAMLESLSANALCRKIESNST